MPALSETVVHWALATFTPEIHLNDFISPSTSIEKTCCILLEAAPYIVRWQIWGFGQMLRRMSSYDRTCATLSTMNSHQRCPLRFNRSIQQVMHDRVDVIMPSVKACLNNIAVHGHSLFFFVTNAVPHGWHTEHSPDNLFTTSTNDPHRDNHNHRVTPTISCLACHDGFQISTIAKAEAPTTAIQWRP